MWTYWGLFLLWEKCVAACSQESLVLGCPPHPDHDAVLLVVAAWVSSSDCCSCISLAVRSCWGGSSCAAGAVSFPEPQLALCISAERWDGMTGLSNSCGSCNVRYMKLGSLNLRGLVVRPQECSLSWYLVSPSILNILNVLTFWVRARWICPGHGLSLRECGLLLSEVLMLVVAGALISVSTAWLCYEIVWFRTEAVLLWLDQN